MKETSISINPQEVGDMRDIVQNRINLWYQNEWYFLKREEFDRLSKGSFLFCIADLLNVADEQGTINPEPVYQELKASLQEHFSEDKFINAIEFIRQGHWEQL